MFGAGVLGSANNVYARRYRLLQFLLCKGYFLSWNIAIEDLLGAVVIFCGVGVHSRTGKPACYKEYTLY